MHEFGTSVFSGTLSTVAFFSYTILMLVLVVIATNRYVAIVYPVKVICASAFTSRSSRSRALRDNDVVASRGVSMTRIPRKPKSIIIPCRARTVEYDASCYA